MYQFPMQLLVFWIMQTQGFGYFTSSLWKRLTCWCRPVSLADAGTEVFIITVIYSPCKHVKVCVLFPALSWWHRSSRMKKLNNNNMVARSKYLCVLCLADGNGKQLHPPVWGQNRELQAKIRKDPAVSLLSLLETISTRKNDNEKETRNGER